MVDIELNTQCRPDIRIVGNEKTPIVVIDDPIVATDELVRHASQRARFSADDRFVYPGIRADLPPEYAGVLVPELAALITHLYDTPRSYAHQLIHQLFSLITQQTKDLVPLQRMPHSDTRSSCYFATVHYLNPGDHGGTGFFRHRPTGFERITQQRYQSYIHTANVHVEANGLPAPKYIDSSDDQFELIAEVDYRPNRLIMYPGNLLHSGLIQPDRDINADPSTGRLTANLFLYFTERGREAIR